MNNDKTLINKLWWLNQFLNRQFAGKEYKEVAGKELDTDTCREIDDIVAHIKEVY